MKVLLPVAAVAVASAAIVAIQEHPAVTTITGHVAKAERLEGGDPRAKLSVPMGFEISTFATGR
jgi:uncharacterized membrane protein YdfJ with MMPL/SSD domain